MQIRGGSEQMWAKTQMHAKKYQKKANRWRLFQIGVITRT
jgi:hypothetical protein